MCNERIPYCLGDKVTGIARFVGPEVHINSDGTGLVDGGNQIVTQESRLSRTARSRQKQPGSTCGAQGIMTQKHGSESLRELGAMVYWVFIHDYLP